MFKKIMTAGIMCLALANSATAQGAAGAGAGGVVIGGAAIGAVAIGNWCCCSGGGCGRWGHFRDYRHRQLRPKFLDFNSVKI